jgi:hypothetical protein
MSESPRYAARWLYPLTTAFLMLAVGCHSFKLLGDRPDKPEKAEKDQGLAAPCKRSLRVSQFAFLSDFELQRNLPIFRELSDLRDQVYKDLQLPSANTVIQVYLFEDRARYERFMLAKYPDLPKRRAFFVAQPRSVGGTEDLLVYTYWGDRIQQDLRHELTHALLHSVLKDVPLWLDEGLAEYFEVPPDWNGTNYRHLGLLRHGPDGSFKPDLGRLEQLNEVQQMTPAEYREAWAWVHFMLRTKPEAKAVLLAYLQQLRTNPNPGPLGPRLVAVTPALDDALNRHLDQLEATMRAPVLTPP